MSKEYVEQHDGGYYITDKRIALDSVVYAFRRGAAPESILRSFPLLKLEEIYGAIAYYLSHQAEIDEYLAKGEVEYERQRKATRTADPEFYKKTDAAKSGLHQGSARDN